jgi:predicted MPP superfamily phosphohydrolase
MGLTISLLLSGIVHTAAQVADSMAHREKPISPERRRFVGYAAAVFPAAALTGSVAGIATTFSPIAVPVRRLPVSGLPGPLIGLKIAHLSDLHLGFYVHLDDLEEVVKKIAVHKPDLVLFTGDICDDLQKLRQTLRIVDRLAPPFGIYASVGNHEYYRGIGRVLEIFRQAPFPILINESVPININGVSVHLGGADDPVHMRPDIADFMHGTIARTMRKAGNGAFRLLMSHRPQGLDHSADMGINLVLAGHTHGGQLGLGGRSLLEGLYPERYFWGIYHKGITTLHTSGGMGHWFPFRIGVPAEAPILVLEKG